MNYVKAIIITLLLSVPLSVSADLTKEEQNAIIRLFNYKKVSDHITLSDYREGPTRWAVFFDGCRCSNEMDWHGIGNDLSKIVDEAISAFEKIKCE